ncbi:conserved protein of unknown function [Pseudomonas marincola]|uniref:Uncharacterized protein n=1 Tax=Pseudomonas marincola TaxID=437900 RepID=A0A653DZU3_9PSED|nr:conserved protein of unknown function [Pseudomonas marincola]
MWCCGNCHDGLRCCARYPSSGRPVFGVRVRCSGVPWVGGVFGDALMRRVRVAAGAATRGASGINGVRGWRGI